MITQLPSQHETALELRADYAIFQSRTLTVQQIKQRTAVLGVLHISRFGAESKLPEPVRVPHVGSAEIEPIALKLRP